MSYLNTIEYTVQPTKSFCVVHNCSGCGAKSRFVNTNRFRVNANGNKLDVWLIYQCDKCKHTLNVSIYERIKSSTIPREEYEKFLQNDEVFAEDYGKTLSFFKKNRLITDAEQQEYILVDYFGKTPEESATFEPGTCVKVKNPYQVQLREEKVIALVFGFSRSTIKKLMDTGKIRIQKKTDCWEIYLE